MHTTIEATNPFASNPFASNPFASNPFASNPFAFWAKANMAAVAASMEIIKASTTAATSLLSNTTFEPAGGSARREIAATSYEARVAEIRGSSGSAPSSATGASTGKSWYRAPYRSPFDPLFWMTPGHPVDHVSDWMRPALAAGAALGNPFAAPFAAPYSAPLGSQLPDWQAAAWMSPMAVWANMMPTSSPASSSAATRAATNVVDFESAYAAYRTAGGHASAQITREPPRSSPAPSAREATDASASIWGFPFAMFGWPPRFS